MGWFKREPQELVLTESHTAEIVEKLYEKLFPDVSAEAIRSLHEDDDVLERIDKLATTVVKGAEDKIQQAVTDCFAQGLLRDSERLWKRIEDYDKAIATRTIDASAIWKRLQAAEVAIEGLNRIEPKLADLSGQERRATLSAQQMVKDSENALLRVVHGCSIQVENLTDVIVGLEKATAEESEALKKAVADVSRSGIGITEVLLELKAKIDEHTVNFELLCDHLHGTIGDEPRKPELVVSSEEVLVPNELRNVLDSAIKDGRSVTVKVEAVPSRRAFIPDVEKGKKK